MAEQTVYLHNSQDKDFIRTEWLKFAKETLGAKEHLDIILFPAEEMHELHFYVDSGLIEWTETETGSYNITRGKVICFEKRAPIYMHLKKKLVGAIVEQSEIGSFLRQKYQGIMAKTSKTFPVDVINLDYDGNLSKNNIPIQEVTDLIFRFQALHGISFSFFMTWPECEDDDEQVYKDALADTITSNLSDPRATNFKDRFEETFDNVEALDYDNLSMIGMLKIIIATSSNYNYNLNKNECYVYGGANNRKKMYSILLNFNHTPNASRHDIYSDNVVKSLHEITDLNTAE